MKRWFTRFWIATDLWANVVLFNGKFGETISARVGLKRKWYDDLVADVLNEIQKNHTKNAIHHDEERDMEALRDLENFNK